MKTLLALGAAAVALIAGSADAAIYTFTYQSLFGIVPGVSATGSGSFGTNIASGLVTQADLTSFSFAATAVVPSGPLTGSYTFNSGLSDVNLFAATVDPLGVSHLLVEADATGPGGLPSVFGSVPTFTLSNTQPATAAYTVGRLTLNAGAAPGAPGPELGLGLLPALTGAGALAAMRGRKRRRVPA